MKDVRDNVFSFLDDWYGQLNDIVDELKEHNFEVLDSNAEYISVVDKEDKEYVLKLGGTSRTITIDKIESLDESLIPIQEYWDEDEWDDDELANIYGGDTAQSQKDIADDMKELYLNEASHPRLGKKVKSLKGWKIYQGTTVDGEEIFRCFVPDDDRPAVGYEDWECETLEQAISWIENYDLEESIEVNKENNKDDSKKVLDDDLSEENDDLIVVEYVTSGDDEVDIQERTFAVNENKDTLIEQDTFGNYEENIFTALDNIEILASSYKEVDKDTLKELIGRLEDELDTLKKINMKIITGIKQYTL